MQKSLPAFALLELLVASVLSTALFLAATAVVRNYNQILARNMALAQLNGHQSIVENFMKRLINNAGYQNIDNNLGDHPGCFLSASPVLLSAAYDTLSGTRERVDLDLVATTGLHRGFDAGNGVLEFSIYDWNSSSKQFVFRNRWDGPLVDQVEGFYVSASPSGCNPELIIVGVLLRSRKPVFHSPRPQSFSSENFSLATVSSTHIFSYNEFLVAPKNVVLR